MKTALVREPQPTPPLPDGPLTPASNPGVASLLDYLAEELAREYVRLMEVAANDGRGAGSSEGRVNMRAAIYARCSSENQRPKSMEDQISTCRCLAAKREFTVLDEHIYTDQAQSGARRDRNGLA